MAEGILNTIGAYPEIPIREVKVNGYNIPYWEYWFTHRETNIFTRPCNLVEEKNWNKAIIKNANMIRGTKNNREILSAQSICRTYYFDERITFSDLDSIIDKTKPISPCIIDKVINLFLKQKYFKKDDSANNRVFVANVSITEEICRTAPEDLDMVVAPSIKKLLAGGNSAQPYFYVFPFHLKDSGWIVIKFSPHIDNATTVILSDDNVKEAALSLKEKVRTLVLHIWKESEMYAWETLQKEQDKSKDCIIKPQVTHGNNSGLHVITVLEMYMRWNGCEGYTDPTYYKNWSLDGICKEIYMMFKEGGGVSGFNTRFLLVDVMLSYPAGDTNSITMMPPEPRNFKISSFHKMSFLNQLQKYYNEDLEDLPDPSTFERSLDLFREKVVATKTAQVDFDTYHVNSCSTERNESDNSGKSCDLVRKKVHGGSSTSLSTNFLMYLSHHYTFDISFYLMDGTNKRLCSCPCALKFDSLRNVFDINLCRPCNRDGLFTPVDLLKHLEITHESHHQVTFHYLKVLHRNGPQRHIFDVYRRNKESLENDPIMQTLSIHNPRAGNYSSNPKLGYNQQTGATKRINTSNTNQSSGNARGSCTRPDVKNNAKSRSKETRNQSHYNHNERNRRGFNKSMGNNNRWGKEGRDRGFEQSAPGSNRSCQMKYKNRNHNTTKKDYNCGNENRHKGWQKNTGASRQERPSPSSKQKHYSPKDCTDDSASFNLDESDDLASMKYSNNRCTNRESDAIALSHEHAKCLTTTMDCDSEMVSQHSQEENPSLSAASIGDKTSVNNSQSSTCGMSKKRKIVEDEIMERSKIAKEQKYQAKALKIALFKRSVKVIEALIKGGHVSKDLLTTRIRNLKEEKNIRQLSFFFHNSKGLPGFKVDVYKKCNIKVYLKDDIISNDIDDISVDNVICEVCHDRFQNRPIKICLYHLNNAIRANLNTKSKSKGCYVVDVNELCNSPCDTNLNQHSSDYLQTESFKVTSSQPISDCSKVSSPPSTLDSTTTASKSNIKPDNFPATTKMKNKGNVLLLGISYADINSISQNTNIQSNSVEMNNNGIHQIIELVKAKKLNELEARDLSRVLAVESSGDTKCYTISLETGCVSTDRHTNANFNRENFCKLLRDKYGPIRFRQVVLDYFWIPSGTWQSSHWLPSFFRRTLPDFVTRNMLDFGKDANHSSASIYLPFSLHCLRQIISAQNILFEYYTIEFLGMDQLQENTLWAATSTIDEEVMKIWLGKNIDQENLYCTFSEKDIMQSLDDGCVSKDDVLSVVRRIPHIQDIRMIKLKALQIYDPIDTRMDSMSEGVCDNELGFNIGGFLNLTDRSSDDTVAGEAKSHTVRGTDTVYYIRDGQEMIYTHELKNSFMTKEEFASNFQNAKIAFMDNRNVHDRPDKQTGALTIVEVGNRRRLCVCLRFVSNPPCAEFLSWDGDIDALLNYESFEFLNMHQIFNYWSFVRIPAEKISSTKMSFISQVFGPQLGLTTYPGEKSYNDRKNLCVDHKGGDILDVPSLERLRRFRPVPPTKLYRVIYTTCPAIKKSTHSDTSQNHSSSTTLVALFRKPVLTIWFARIQEFVRVKIDALQNIPPTFESENLFNNFLLENKVGDIEQYLVPSDLQHPIRLKVLSDRDFEVRWNKTTRSKVCYIGSRRFILSEEQGPLENNDGVCLSTISIDGRLLNRKTVQKAATFETVRRLEAMYGSGHTRNRMSHLGFNSYRGPRNSDRVVARPCMDPESVKEHQYFNESNNKEQFLQAEFENNISSKLITYASDYGCEEHRLLFNAIDDCCDRTILTSGKSTTAFTLGLQDPIVQQKKKLRAKSITLVPLGFCSTSHVDSCDLLKAEEDITFFRSSTASPYITKLHDLVGCGLPTTCQYRHIWERSYDETKQHYDACSYFMFESLNIAHNLVDMTSMLFLGYSFMHCTSFCYLIDKRTSRIITSNSPSDMFSLFAWGSSGGSKDRNRRRQNVNNMRGRLRRRHR